MKKFLYSLAIFVLSLNANGQTWWIQNTQTKSDISDVFFVTDNVGWAFGDSLDVFGGFATGIALHSTSKEGDWIFQNMGSPIYQIKDSYFFNTLKGIAIGRNKLSGNGVMITTFDGGSTWTASPPLIERLQKIFFIDANNGWAVGRNDFVLRTNDGGNTWVDISATTGNHLFGVHFTNTKNGYVVGRSGNIIHTTDSGTTWNTQISGTGNDLNAVYFSNDSTGWAIGFAGTILNTTDRGTTWNAQTSGTGNDLFDVQFVNNTIGWAVGITGTILKTTNGGVTWNVETSGTTEDLFSISMRNDSLGWVSGTNGTILVYAANPPAASVSGTGIRGLQYSKDQVAVYLNPCNEQICVTTKIINYSIHLYNYLGEVVYESHNNNSTTLNIESANFKSGMYFLRVSSKNNIEVFSNKLVLLHP